MVAIKPWRKRIIHHKFGNNFSGIIIIVGVKHASCYHAPTIMASNFHSLLLTYLNKCVNLSNMANIKSAKKRIAVTQKKSARNRSQKSELVTYIKKYRTAPTPELLSKVTSLLDKATQDNLIHANKANRIKAKLAKINPAPKKPRTKPTA